MTTLFIFGAGASFGSKKVFPYPPPLGKSLFEELLKFSPAARELPEAVKTRFGGKSPDFEKGMEFLFNDHNILTSTFLNQMAAYFIYFKLGNPRKGLIQYPSPSSEDIMSKPFYPTDLSKPSFPPIIFKVKENYYETLLKTILASDRKVILSTTNYDLLIEDAIESVGKDVSYNFEQSNEYITLLKPHGSCNFLPDFKGSTIRGLDYEIKEGQQIVGLKNAPFIVEKYLAVDRSEAQTFFDLNDCIPPIIAMYMPSKEAICGRELMFDQFKKWIESVNEATDIITIGLRLHRDNNGAWNDKRLWDPIIKSKANIHYVGDEAETVIEWANEHNKTNVSVIAKNFEEALNPITDILCPKGLTNEQLNGIDDHNFIPRKGNYMRRYRDFVL